MACFLLGASPADSVAVLCVGFVGGKTNKRTNYNIKNISVFEAKGTMDKAKRDLVSTD